MLPQRHIGYAKDSVLLYNKCLYCVVCMYVSMYVCMYVCMYMYMYVCIHVCMYVRMYVCMHVYGWIGWIKNYTISSILADSSFKPPPFHTGRGVKEKVHLACDFELS